MKATSPSADRKGASVPTSDHSQSETGGAAPPATADGTTVLVVDDYRSLCDVIAGMLRPRGYRVLTASSGAEAKVLAQTNARIDLLLTDLEMPEMRGDELADWFRAAKSETRILFMSSHSAAVQAHEPHHFLQKPIRVEALLSAVREVLNHQAT